MADEIMILYKPYLFRFPRIFVLVPDYNESLIEWQMTALGEAPVAKPTNECLLDRNSEYLITVSSGNIYHHFDGDCSNGTRALLRTAILADSRVELTDK